MAEINFRQKCNHENSLITKHCKLDNASMSLLERAMESMGFSARAYHRVLKIARTIADMDASETVSSIHIAEAIQ